MVSAEFEFQLELLAKFHADIIIFQDYKTVRAALFGLSSVKYVVSSINLKKKNSIFWFSSIVKVLMQ